MGECSRILDAPMMGHPMLERREWVHPTGRNPKSISIIALGPSKGDLLDVTTGHQPPAEIMDCDEVWGINGGANHFGGIVAYDMLWVMDHLDGEAIREPRYMELVERWATRHESPIMTSRAAAHQYRRIPDQRNRAGVRS